MFLQHNKVESPEKWMWSSRFSVPSFSFSFSFHSIIPNIPAMDTETNGMALAQIKKNRVSNISFCCNQITKSATIYVHEPRQMCIIIMFNAFVLHGKNMKKLENTVCERSACAYLNPSMHLYQISTRCHRQTKIVPKHQSIVYEYCASC